MNQEKWYKTWVIDSGSSRERTSADVRFDGGHGDTAFS
jgi:hypothetical protein